MSEFQKIFSFIRNIISLYLTITRINVKLVVIMGGDHLATWEFEDSNKMKINSYIFCVTSGTQV